MDVASDLLDIYRPDISHFLLESEAPPFRRAQILDHLLQRPGLTFAGATNLPLSVRASLDELGSSTMTLQDSVSSSDGATKLLLRTMDGVAVETVIMRYRDRVTACVSSQAGCPVGCAFCATGALGFARNLLPAEIVDQVRAAATIIAEENRRLSNLVYMGMGEPLLNLQSALDSIRILTDSHGMNFAHRSISVSTVGIPSGIRRLARTEPQVNLAISLHAADDRTRALLIPGKFRHPVADVLAAAWEHFEITRRKLLVEYVLIDGINDSVDDARRLAALLRGHVVAVNLLAWNPIQARLRRDLNVGMTCNAADGKTLNPMRSRAAAERRNPDSSGPEGQETGRTSAPRAAATENRASMKRQATTERHDLRNRRALADHLFLPTVGGCLLRSPSHEAITAFRNTLTAARIETVLRQSKGTSIHAACGQLAAHADDYARPAIGGKLTSRSRFR
ncbi:MAG: 23S rRNA (adenine(2503)-C(2))-methyltransferase RlmN [Actinobacteria bacterium]|nr:23S rRNA (adenine(2503)-C(2))-methyltransferase RlmN [Actinomycetota bacterium]